MVRKHSWLFQMSFVQPPFGWQFGRDKRRRVTQITKEKPGTDIMIIIVDVDKANFKILTELKDDVCSKIT